MELFQFAAQEVDGGEADHQMLADGPVVEGIGSARQFDLAMQRLVGDAEQGAIGHAQAITLRRDGPRFHVDGDGARQVDAAALLRPAQFPVAVVIGDDGAGAQPRFELLAAFARHLGGGFLQRHLDFGQRRDGDIGRHGAVENAVLAEISMRQHIVADALRLA